MGESVVILNTSTTATFKKVVAVKCSLLWIMLVVAYNAAHSVHLLSHAPKCMFLQTVYKCAAFSDKTRCYRGLRRGVDTLFSHGGLWSWRLICPLAALPLAAVLVVLNGLLVARFHAGCSKYGVERNISFVNENIVRKLIEI